MNDVARTIRETIEEQITNPEFAEEWAALEPEYQLVKAMLQAREEEKITQEQLAERTGISQADISRMEGARANPSLQTMKRIAQGLGKRLVIRFS